MDKKKKKNPPHNVMLYVFISPCAECSGPDPGGHGAADAGDGGLRGQAQSHSRRQGHVHSPPALRQGTGASEGEKQTAAAANRRYTAAQRARNASRQPC